MMTLFYEGSDGTKIDFMTDPIFAQSPETLLQHEWLSDIVATTSNHARIKRFYKSASESTLKLSIMADTKEGYTKLMDKLHHVFDRDVRKMKPGKIWWNDWYKECFIVTTTYSGFEEYFLSVEVTLKVLSVYPYWVKASTNQYMSYSPVIGIRDYPYDYHNLDYDGSQNSIILINDGIHESNFEMIFYGPCVDPSIRIGEHAYTVFDELSEGEYIRVNSITKKMVKFSIYGEETNVFDLRDRVFYIFQMIPEGTHVVNLGNCNVDVTLFDERGEPEWLDYSATEDVTEKVKYTLIDSSGGPVTDNLGSIIYLEG